MQFLRTLFWVMIAAFVAIIASENWRDVTLDLWGNLQADIKIPVLLLLAFLLGFLPTWLIMRGKIWQLKRRLMAEEQATPVPPPPPAPAEPTTEGRP
ncbi:MAG TPA: lipopolysaccharide assembly protein LapA domain-containing protein [Sphingomicrobium sp.]|jgi:lipopolysaccharide assembly protein A|nr:lipopolysaccharide assembly protein LapA domain-containing protein [Sphingomicrobium sp.]